MRPSPLAGITVVAVEQAVAAPFATRQLADLGARVIKIERPDGGDFARAYDAAANGLSSHFVWLNRSKESLTLDLKHPDARTVLDRLLFRADVFVQNLGPGAAARLQLDAPTLHARFPRLIACGLSGYGSTGPYASKKAYDLLVQSEAGLVSITGTPDTPCKVGVSVADIAGGMYTYSGILTALFQRERTGEGAALEVSLFEALGEWMGFPMYYAGGGAPPRRTAASHATIVPYGPYRTGDGLILLAVQHQREWVRFCTDVLERPSLAADERFVTNDLRVQNRGAVDAEIAAVFERLPSDAVVARLDAAQIANARINTVDEFIRHPQLASRNAWREIDSPAGPLRALVPPARIDGVDPIMGPIPALGEHSAAILSELGFDAETIARWRVDSVI